MLKRLLAALSAGIMIITMSSLVFATEGSQPVIPNNDVELSQEGKTYTPQSQSSSTPEQAASSQPSENTNGNNGGSNNSSNNNGGSNNGGNNNGNNGGGGSDDLFDTSNVEDIAGQLFDMDGFKLQGTQNNRFVSALNSKGLWLLSLVIGLVPFFVMLHMAVDVLCLLSPLARSFFTKRKRQYFSDEAAKAGGFSLQSGGQQGGYGGGVTPPPATPGGQPGSDAGHPVWEFAKARILTVFLLLLLTVLCGSGRLFSLLGWVINLVIHLLGSIFV